MLLETLDVKKNDILIYSQNIFHPDKNFKIIFKDDPERIARKINYSDVCRFVNEYNPKNLIVYRLLTNIKDFQIDLSKYGFLIYINGEKELIYFDPVFAVKELEEYNKIISLYNLRFRIQQVGLTTLNRKNDVANFAEIYNVDLEATEAKFQNDKVFADAILAFNSSSMQAPSQKSVEKRAYSKPETDSKKEGIVKNNKEAEKKSFADKVKQPIPDVSVDQSENIKLIKHDISEDKDFDYKQVIRMNYKRKSANSEMEKSNNSEKEKSTSFNSAQQESQFGKFLKKKLTEKENDKENDFVDIFKTPSPLKEYIAQKENKKIVLQLRNK